MGILARLLGRRVERRRGPLAEETPEEEQETPHLRRPEPTPTARPIPRPEPTPTTQPYEPPHPTAGTPIHRTPGGTPSTERIHNPKRPGGR